MPRGEPTTPRYLTLAQVLQLGLTVKGVLVARPGVYRLTVSQLAALTVPESVREGEQDAVFALQEAPVTPSIEVPAVTSSPLRQDERQALRSRLDAYKKEYLEAAYRQDWKECDRVNRGREPLFYELWELEKGLSPEKRYWFPARVLNQGHVFKPELTRKA